MASPVGSNSDKTLRHCDATFLELANICINITSVSCMQPYRYDSSHWQGWRYRLADAHTYHARPFLVGEHMSTLRTIGNIESIVL